MLGYFGDAPCRDHTLMDTPTKQYSTRIINLYHILPYHTIYIMWYLWRVRYMYQSCVRCYHFASKLHVLDMVSERFLQVQDLSWPRSEVRGKGCQGEAQCIIACYRQLSYRADLQSNEETQENMNLKISGELLHQCQGWLLVPPANQACALSGSVDVWGLGLCKVILGLENCNVQPLFSWTHLKALGLCLGPVPSTVVVLEKGICKCVSSCFWVWGEEW